ncbi:transcriptional regulator [Pedobacter sp. HMF7647]|uniref:Transcriptional regulator n=1 Tax=Hufsiella arboris TaxID=2695275 RepID=A0A7K1YG40_9SPHI|nr:helix-turn-helix domain-containing protein [Hufsiella arboris]MXV53128.1 transcriptional regulator [Hufsiella arboris]
MEVTIGSKPQSEGSRKIKEHFSDKHATIKHCPVTDIIARISDKWSMHVIIFLGKAGKMRFSEMKKEIEGISQRMLTVTLRNLEEDGLITRTVYAEVPPRVEYQLTSMGESLLLQLIPLSEWANRNMEQILRSREEHILKG